MKIKIKKLTPNAVIPQYAHRGDVGMDFIAISVEYNKEWDCYIYHTGLAFESDYNWGQFLFPRSSNRKTNAYLTNSVGIADSAIYRGEILFCYKNRTSYDDIIFKKAVNNAVDAADSFETYQSIFKQTLSVLKDNQEENALEYAPYKVGDKIGQMVMLSYEDVEFEEVDGLSETERGTNGFGSTDKK